MSTVAAISVEVGADTKPLEDGLAKAGEKVDGFGKKTEKTSESVDGFEKSLKAAAAAAIAYVSIDMAKSAIMSADAFQQLTNRVKVATEATGDFQTTFSELYQSAQSSGQALSTVVGSFQNIAGSAGDLGATNAQIVQFVDTFNKLARVGGSSGEGIANALFQTSQALAGGVLRAEEFNSILEGTPAVARALAESLGMSVGELRKAVNDGKILSEQVFQGILSKSDEINKKLSAIPPNLETGMSVLGNSMQRFIGQLDQSVGLTEAIAKSMTGWSWLIDQATEAMNEQKNARLQFGKIELDLQKEFEQQEKKREDAWFGAEWKKQEELGKRAEIDRYNHDLWTKLQEDKKKKDDEVAQKQLENIRRVAEARNKQQSASYDEFERDLANTDRIKEALAQKVEAIAQSHMSEQELLVQKHASELEILRQAREAEAITEQEYRDLEYKAEADHISRMVDMENERMRKMKAIAEQERQVKVNALAGTFQNLSALMNTGSRELFEIGKAAAIANAIVSAHEAVVRTMASVPYPFNVPLAIAQGVAGAAQVAAISSTQFGSRSSGGAMVYSGGMPAVNTTQGGGGGASGAMSSGAMVNISLEGGDAAQFNGKQIRSLIEQINEAVGDGARIRIA